MSTPKKGDRVRVEFEGEISGVWGKSVDIAFPEGPNGEYTPEAEYVPLSAVTVLKSPLKVGDVIEGEDAYVALPLGTVVERGTGSRLFRTNVGFTDAYGNTFGPHDFEHPRVVAYVPAGEAA